MSNPKRKSILYYWSIRYFLILAISMLILGVCTLYAIQRNALTNQYNSLENMTRDLGSIAVKNGGELPPVPNTGRFLDDLASKHGLNDKPIMFILDRNGSVIQQFPPRTPDDAKQLFTRMSEIMSGNTHVIQLEPVQDRQPYIVGVHPIRINSEITGYAIYFAEKMNLLDGMTSSRYPRLILMSIFLIIGWGIIHTLTRRLIKPIQEAADAAQQIVGGNYNIQLNKEHREKEIYELMRSFKEMADRLNRLEMLRTQLLAGVTHELKTPITSISGLVQAVRKKIVKGKDAEVFLDHCLNECTRLQTMVEDLLDFNSFASGSIQVTLERIELLKIMPAMVARWKHGQAGLTIEVCLEFAEGEADWHVFTDPLRLEQILINLLNNARDAMTVGGTIIVRLISESDRCHIQVQDQGGGIPENEQHDVFESFYRGAAKKTKIRGLGLGLPFSRMIARSMGGDLVLTDSSSSGTTFAIQILRNAK